MSDQPVDVIETVLRLAMLCRCEVIDSAVVKLTKHCKVQVKMCGEDGVELRRTESHMNGVTL